MANRKWDALRGGIGFYVTMVVCLAVIGVSGYFLLFDGREEPLPQQETMIPPESPVTSVAEISIPDEEPVVSVMEPEPVEEVVELIPMPELEIDDMPVVVEQPKQVMEPLQGEVLTAFSVDELLYNETLEDWRIHDGVDIAAEAGTTVMAACAGMVVDVYDDALMGTTVLIDHDDGYRTMYANLESNPIVFAGQAVSAGQVIGTVGTTAVVESAQGPHLHFSVTKDGDVVNPHDYLN